MYKMILLLGTALATLLGNVDLTSKLSKNYVRGSVMEKEAMENLENVTVTLLDQFQKEVYKTKVNLNGLFKFEDVKDGKYTMRIESFSYNTLYQSIDINQNTKLNLGELSLDLEENILDEIVIDYTKK